MRYDDWYPGPSRRCVWCERLKSSSEFRPSDRKEPYAYCMACQQALSAMSEKDRKAEAAKHKWAPHNPYWKPHVRQR